MSEDDAAPTAPTAPGSIRRSLSWTLLGEGVFAACQWFSLMVVAKLGSPEALGRYALGLAVATPIIVLANLHLRPIYVVDVRSRWRFGDYLRLRMLLIPGALAATAGVCLVRGWPALTIGVVLLVALIRASGSATDILYARAQRAEAMDPIGISRAVRGVLWIGMLALGLALGGELLALGLAAAALLLFTLAYDLPRAQAATGPDDLAPSPPGEARRRALRALAWEALPMGVAGGLLGIAGNVPAYVLEASHGLEQVGFFAAVLSIIQASGVFNMALGNAAIPRLAKLANVDADEGDARQFWRLLAKLLGLVLVLNGLGVLAVALIGDLYLRVAYTADYVAYLPQLVLASGAAVVLGLANMLSQTLTALGRFRMQLVLNAVALGFALAIALWRIPTGGLTGAVETLMAVAAFRFALYLGANAAVGPRAR
ncbi:lipopolysaccharide biosynthesis protein [Plesiocystis pacifica]|uniref:lipopolysaccharide biosynthesis protein n=1 Tax=Plesiocystis pacifica TaxID=191768 RepID=UPI0005D4744F|nr:hypothetical protein [Plesiocystis pacifica]